MASYFRSSTGSGQPGYNRLPEQPRAGLPTGPRGTPGATASRAPVSSGYSAGYERRVPPPSVSAVPFSVVKCPTQELASRNRLIVSPSDFENNQHLLINGRFPITALHDPTGKIAPGTVGTSGPQRSWMALSASGEEVTIEPISPSLVHDLYLGSLNIEVSFIKASTQVAEQYSADEMAKVLIKAFSGQMFGMGQIATFDFHGQDIKAVVNGMTALELSASQRKGGSAPVPTGQGASMGILMEKTDITIMKASDSNIKIKSSAKKAPPNAILAPNFKFEDMGIGGLDNEFSGIFRRAFASRVFPPGIVEKLGIQHVKGILLHGPPGTGKTLMARQIGKMLNAREPKVVNGPEILNKYVGASEENIRKLFEDAEKEYKSKGDESGLHIIIFDELDAICKQRGSTGGGTGVGDSVVNQLLSKMDGVDQLNNILVIGMTNRLDMIDEALLRPGRMEVHMEISLPDEKGRLQILDIHTSKMRTNGIMDRDVDLGELASMTKNFSGAEIGGLVKSATSFAFNRHVKVGSVAGIADDVDKLKVKRGDFINALDEVHPAFGVAEEELQQVVQNGIIHYDHTVDNLLHNGSLFVEQVRSSQRTPRVSVLLHGPPGSGKTALAATIAQASGFPFIKLITPESMVGMNDLQKVSMINKAFMDSYKSPMSVIVVDNIERLLEWVPIGPRFSNSVLQALLILMGRLPPNGKRLLILATTSLRPAITELQLSDIFDAEMKVPAISTIPAFENVLRELELFRQPQELQRAVQLLSQSGFGRGDEYDQLKMTVGVKKLLSIVEMARQEPEEVAERLISAIVGLSA